MVRARTPSANPIRTDRDVNRIAVHGKEERSSGLRRPVGPALAADCWRARADTRQADVTAAKNIGTGTRRICPRRSRQRTRRSVNCSEVHGICSTRSSMASRAREMRRAYGSSIFIPDINPVSVSIVRELILKHVGNKFPSINFHQSEAQLYKSDTFLTKHDVLQCRNERQT
jgi:hypothetical protein